MPSKKQTAIEKANVSISRYRLLIDEMDAKDEGNLRFKSKYVKVSEIAAQYYCEKKVELTRIHGEEETPEMKVGSIAHEGLLVDTVKAEMGEVLREIFSGKPTAVREMPLLGKHNDVIIRGVADLLVFQRGSPLPSV